MGDLGWVSKDKFPSDFSKKVFKLKEVGNYVIFPTLIGHHFVLVTHIRKPKIYSFKEVENYIKNKIRKDKQERIWKIIEEKMKKNPSKYKDMVLIPGGEIYVGFNSKEIKERYKTWEKYVRPYVNQEKPGWMNYIKNTYKKVKVNPFYIDKYEVSYGKYKKFLKATNHRPLPQWVEKFIPGDDYPVVGVSWINEGFLPQELWLYQYTKPGREMRNIESLTDGLRCFIYSILWYTKSDKVQILVHGEETILAQATIKKYHLYHLIHAIVYIAGPFHGSFNYTYVKALKGSPVCSNLAIGSDFLQDIILPDETPYNVFENENTKKYWHKIYDNI